MSVLTAGVLADLNKGKVVASDVGATIVGVSQDNQAEFLVDLALAVSRGELEAQKFPVAVKAAAITGDLAYELSHVIWLLWVSTEKPETEIRGRLVELIKTLLLEHLVTKPILLEILPSDALAEAALVPTELRFNQAQTRVRTKTYYTQLKYNLFREDCEGYAKLVTLLGHFGTGDVSLSITRAEIKQLIGTFSLDPNRVADLCYEAFECHLDQHGFVQLLPMFGPAAMLHMLGLKFQMEQKEKRPTPLSLCMAAAYMIKEHHVSLEALLGHLEPSDEEAMQAQSQAMNGLNDARKGIGAVRLGQSTVGEVVTDARHQWQAQHLKLGVRGIGANFAMVMGSRNQKLRLVEALLQVGDWEHAYTLISHLKASQYHLANVTACFASALCKLARKMLQPVLDDLFPKGMRRSNLLKNEVPRQEPRISDQCGEMLLLLGLHIYNDAQLATDLARVTRFQLLYHLPRCKPKESVAAEHTAADWDGRPPDAEAAASSAEAAVLKAMQFIKRCLLPAVALLPEHPFIGDEVWQAVRLLPFHQRAELYADLRSQQEKQLLLSCAAKMATVALKRVFGRLHIDEDKRKRSEAMRPYARVISKIAYSASLTLVDYIIKRVEDAPNLIGAVLDAAKSLPSMSYDIMTWAILDRLEDTSRSKIKADGTSISDWLQNLAAFAGQAANKYVGDGGLDITAICQYFVTKLREDVQGEASYDLLVLKELIGNMTGINPAGDVSEVQALAGGDLLQSWLLHAQSKLPQAKTYRSGSTALLQALQQGSPEHHTLVPLLILLAQQMQIIAASHTSSQLKFIAELSDKCQQTLYQYIKFLSTSMSLERYAKTLPPFGEMAHDYGLPPEVVFAIYRPLLAGMHPPVQTVAEDGEIEGTVPGEGPAEMQSEHYGLTWEQVVEDVRSMVVPSTWQRIHPSFYICFWTLTFSDIHYPGALYDSTLASLKGAIPMAEEEVRDMRVDLAKQEQMRLELERSRKLGYLTMGEVPENVTPGQIQALEKKIQRMHEVYKRLPDEAKRRKRAVPEVLACLKRDCDTWSAVSSDANNNNVSVTLLETCVMPRVLFSPEDAMLCAEFILQAFTLQSFGTSFLYYIRKIMQGLGIMLSCTDREAQNYGIFLREIYASINRWHASEADFNAECPASVAHASRPPANQSITHEQMQTIAFNLQIQAGRQFVSSLRSKEWVHLNNTLAVLMKILKVFPTLQPVAANLKREARRIATSDERADIRTAANAYACALEGELKRSDRIFSPEDFGGGPKPVPKPSPDEKVAQSNGQPPLANGGPLPKPEIVARDSTTPEPGQVEVSDGPIAPSPAKKSPATASVDQTARQRSPLRPNAKVFEPSRPVHPAPAADTAAQPPNKRAKLEEPAEGSKGTDRRTRSANVKVDGADTAPAINDRKARDESSTAAAQASKPKPDLEDIRAKALQQQRQKAQPAPTNATRAHPSSTTAGADGRTSRDAPADAPRRGVHARIEFKPPPKSEAESHKAPPKRDRDSDRGEKAAHEPGVEASPSKRQKLQEAVPALAQANDTRKEVARIVAGTPPLRSSSRSEGAAEAAQGGTAPDSLERDRTRSRSSSRRESAEAMLAADASGSGRRPDPRSSRREPDAAAEPLPREAAPPVRRTESRVRPLPVAEAAKEAAASAVAADARRGEPRSSRASRDHDRDVRRGSGSGERERELRPQASGRALHEAEPASGSAPDRAGPPAEVQRQAPEQSSLADRWQADGEASGVLEGAPLPDTQSEHSDSPRRLSSSAQKKEKKDKKDKTHKKEKTAKKEKKDKGHKHKDKDKDKEAEERKHKRHKSKRESGEGAP